MGGCTSVSISATSNVHLIHLRRKNSCVKISIQTNTFVPYVYVPVFSAQWGANATQDSNNIRLKLLKQGLKKVKKNYNLENTSIVYILVFEDESPMLQAAGFRCIGYQYPKVEMEGVLHDVLTNITNHI